MKVGNVRHQTCLGSSRTFRLAMGDGNGGWGGDGGGCGHCVHFYFLFTHPVVNVYKKSCSGNAIEGGYYMPVSLFLMIGYCHSDWQWQEKSRLYPPPSRTVILCWIPGPFLIPQWTSLRWQRKGDDKAKQDGTFIWIKLLCFATLESMNLLNQW